VAGRGRVGLVFVWWFLVLGRGWLAFSRPVFSFFCFFLFFFFLSFVFPVFFLLRFFFVRFVFFALRSVPPSFYIIGSTGLFSFCPLFPPLATIAPMWR
jgi:hypothetical protein